jgi:hypothetical protein
MQGANSAGLSVGSQSPGGAVVFDALTGNLQTVSSVAGFAGAPRFRGINDAGLISGYAGQRAIVGTLAGGFTALPVDGAATAFGEGLNNVGQLVGNFTDANGLTHGFIASSVPEPASAALCLAGLGLLGGWRLRSKASRQGPLSHRRRLEQMKPPKTWAAAAAMLALSGAAQAALVNRGGGMIFDTTRNITWLADMNHANTSGHTGTGVNADGTMTWAAATTWANNLTYGGFDDWRMPTLNTGDTTCSDSFTINPSLPRQYVGYHCTGGELSGLFVTDLGNKPNESVLNQAGDTAEQIANLALFSNVQSSFYWSDTVYVGDPASAAFFFITRIGYQGYYAKDFAAYALAVRSGDVAADVPEPQTLALALLALCATALTRARRG